MKDSEANTRMVEILKRNSQAPSDPWRMAQIEKIRAAMGPEFRAVADQLRDQFGAQLTWLDTDDLKIGKPP